MLNVFVIKLCQVKVKIQKIWKMNLHSIVLYGVIIILIKIWHYLIWNNMEIEMIIQVYIQNNYIVHEDYDFYPGLEADGEELYETHNWIAGSKDDVNYRGYLAA